MPVVKVLGQGLDRSKVQGVHEVHGLADIIDG